MRLCKLNVSSTFAAQTRKQSKRMIIQQISFKVGEVYLFHKENSECPDVESLWGLYDKRVEDAIYLETCTLDQKHFFRGQRLPAEYRFCRLSARHELRDYIANCICSEIGNFKKDNSVHD